MTRTLYQRLGGYDVVAAIIDDFLVRQRADPRLARFGAGRSEDTRKKGRQLLVDQLCALAGGPCLYIGRDMKSSHKGLGITEDDWKRTIAILRESMDEQKVSPSEQDEVVALWTQYKSEIVE
jgi:hemoglobin